MSSDQRDWDRELAKIDRQLASMSDDQLLETTKPKPAAQPGAAPATETARPTAAAPSRLGVILRLSLAGVLAVGMTLWPYSSACGFGLAGYLAATAAVIGAGAWAGIATWRARAARGHIFALCVLAWGLTLAAIEVLPRAGYATDPARASWTCQ